MATVQSILNKYHLPASSFSKSDLGTDLKNPLFLAVLDAMASPPPQTQQEAFSTAKKLIKLVDFKKLRSLHIKRPFRPAISVYDLVSSVNPAFRGNFNYNITDIFNKEFVRKNASVALTLINNPPQELAKFKQLKSCLKKLTPIVNALKKDSLSLLSSNGEPLSQSMLNMAFASRKESSVLLVLKRPDLSFLKDKAFYYEWLKEALLLLVMYSILFLFIYSAEDRIMFQNASASEITIAISVYILFTLFYGYVRYQDKKKKTSAGLSRFPFFGELSKLLKAKASLSIEPNDKPLHILSEGELPTSECYTGELSQEVEVLSMATILHGNPEWLPQFKQIIERSPKVSDCKDELIHIFEDIAKGKYCEKCPSKGTCPHYKFEMQKSKKKVKLKKWT